MPLHLISHELMNQPETEDYALFWATLKSMKAVRIQKALWVVDSPLTSREVHWELIRRVDALSDRLFVCQLDLEAEDAVAWSVAKEGASDLLKAAIWSKKGR